MDRKLLLGKRIKELRKSRGYTQDFLAEKLNIEPRQLSKLETGKNYPSFETVILLLKAFDITFEELLEYEHLDKNCDCRELIMKKLDNMDERRVKEVFKIIKSINP